MHRIDKDTSGLLLIAEGAQSARSLTAGFKEHRIKKYYLAIVVGKPPASGVISASLQKTGGKGFEKMVVDEESRQQAVTDFICLDNAGIVSLVGFSPSTAPTSCVPCRPYWNPYIGGWQVGGRAYWRVR